MNISQLHERLRLELLRRIERGVLNGTLLSRQTGLKAAHISNFLRQKRRLSLSALDRVMAAQSLGVEDLLPMASGHKHAPSKDEPAATMVPLVPQSVAIHDLQIRKSSILEQIQLPSGYLDHLRARCSVARRDWERFVAVRINAAQADPMRPLLSPHNILIVDRRHNSFAPHHPHKPNLYAVHLNGNILFRYASYQANCLILRPHLAELPLTVIEPSPGISPTDFIIGRVCVNIAEL